MERSRSPCRKYLEARRGGSSWTTSLERECACLSRTATNQWTASVCSTFLSSCRLLLPETLRQSRGDLRVCGRHAPPLPRRSDRGPVPACEHRQPPVVEGKAAASLDVEIDREAQPLEPHEDAGEHRPLHSQQLSQVGGRDPRPV